MYGEVLNLFIDPILNIWKIIINYMPKIVSALLFILFGLFLARVLRSIIEQFLRKIKLDASTSRIGINEVMARFGFGKSPSYAIGFIVYWSVILVSFVSAFEILKLTIISEIFVKFVIGFIPKIVSAIFIAFGGLLFAKFLAEVVLNSATANNLRGGQALSRIVHFIILIFTTIVALEQIGIGLSAIKSSLNIILGSIGLAFAIAVGFGAKDIAKEVIQEMLTETKDNKKE